MTPFKSSHSKGEETTDQTMGRSFFRALASITWRHKKSTAMASILLICSAVGGFGYSMAEMLLFTGRSSKADWHTPTPASCTGWTQDTGFRLDADAIESSAGLAISPKTPLMFGCTELLTLPADHRITTTDDGLPIHYVVFPTEETDTGSSEQFDSLADRAGQGSATAPLWVHFHGVNGTYLHGARYLAAARRIGFQLVAAELSNHGTSGYTSRGAAYGCSERDDVIAVIRDLLTLAPGRNIFITASSMGTMALTLAQQELMRLDTAHRIIGYALESPISSVGEIISESPAIPHFPSLLVQIGLAFAQFKSGYDFEVCKPLESYNHFSRPVLVQHAETDGFAPVAMAKRVFGALPQAIPKRLKVYPKGDHSAVWNGQPAAFEADLREIWQLGLAYRDELRVASKPGKSPEP